jgi:Raf kinase inhibitor-like YbhB/YbcL family protein
VNGRGWLPALALPLALLAGCGGDQPAPPAPAAAEAMTVTSSAFQDGGTIPAEFTCSGAGHRPPLTWTGGEGARSYAIVVVDPDAPSGNYYHWVVLDLPTGTKSVAGPLPEGAHELKNTGGKKGWTPPCPPSGTHHYKFTVYALSKVVNASSIEGAFSEIEKSTIAQGALTGLVTH